MKAIELHLSKESGKKKKKKEIALTRIGLTNMPLATKASFDTQHEFEEGQDFEEAAIDGFLKPYKVFIKDQTARQR